MIAALPLLLEVVAHWQGQGLARAPARDSDFLEARQRLGADVPEALAALLAHADGMNPFSYDAARFRFWPTAELVRARTLSDLDAYEPYVAFADFCIDAHAYGIRVGGGLGEGGIVIVSGGPPVSVAVSLNQFIERYLSQPDLVLR